MANIKSINGNPIVLDSSGLEDDAVIGDKIHDGAVRNSKLADNAVTTDKIAPHTITYADISVTGTDRIHQDNLNDGAVGTRVLANGAVTQEKITTGYSLVTNAEKQAISSIPSYKLEVANVLSAIGMGSQDLEIKYDSGHYWSPSSGAWASGTSYKYTDKVLTIPKMKFVFTVDNSTTDNYAIFYDNNGSHVSTVYSVSSGMTVTVPASACYVAFTLNANSTAGNFVNVAYDIESIESAVSEALQEINITPEQTTFFDAQSKNLINPDNVSHTLRYRQSDMRIINRDGNYSCSGFIEVQEGETYTLSGTYNGFYQGGYFGADAELVALQTGIANIEFFNPVSGYGKCFTVPSNRGIKYVVLNFFDNGGDGEGHYELLGSPQLEHGEMATDYEPYDGSLYIKEEYIKGSSSSSSGTSVSAFDLLPRPKYDTSKISSFKNHWLKKDKDLMVVGTGTSLTSRSIEHCTARDDAPLRPPLFHSNNFASAIWDAIKWEGQQYRRYDSGFFTEVGSFSTDHALQNWDDNNYRSGLTRHASGTASVAFTVPSEAWQFNFIYRTDDAGSESCTVSVAEGNGKMQVYDGSDWVEANGYQFSMLQEVENLNNLQIPNPNTVNNSKVSVSSYQVGGNTTYQKRLKMRCKAASFDSTGTTKRVTISSASGRLMYWGVEWSPREFMITYVNAARGSHDITYDSPRCLSHFQDNEIWSFKPDLIFTENPIHNSGGGNAPSSSYHTTYWGFITYNFFFNADNPVSLVSRALENGVSNLEWVIFDSSITWNFGAIDENGQLKLTRNVDNMVLTALDAQTLSNMSLIDDALVINACKYWVDSAIKVYGNLKIATSGSGKDGETLTNEGSHWNDRGCELMAKCIVPLFDFYD